MDDIFSSSSGPIFEAFSESSIILFQYPAMFIGYMKLLRLTGVLGFYVY
jgi:hypothetical protein